MTTTLNPWRLAAELRDLSQAHNTEIPAYLLAYEVAVILDHTPDLRQRMLLELLFHCGGRISEVLNLTPGDFSLNVSRPVVALRTLKQRGKGRPRKDNPIKRLVPLLDPDFVVRLKHYLVTFSSGQQKRLWAITSQTARNWLAASLARCAAAGIHFPVPIKIHTLRHSYAMHLLLWGRIHIKRLQSYLGHHSLRSTETYTLALSLDAAISEPPLSFSVATQDNPLLSARPAPQPWLTGIKNAST